MSDELARAKSVIILQMKEIELLRAHVKGLEAAIDKEIGGAHAELIRQYSNPRLSEAARRAAAGLAIPYKKAKVGSVQQHEHRFELYSYMEPRRLAKRQTAKVITASVVEADPSPAS